MFTTLVLIGINCQFTINCMHCIVPMYLYVFLSVIAMAGLNYYKPQFNWDAIDKLSELDHFKAECEVLFNGPLDESPPNRQA